MELGYAGTIARLVRAIAGACNDRELGRLLQLVDLAGRFDPRSTLRPGDFVAFVEMERIADATPSTVSVMTIHQSKGLEFDHVILPELEGKLAGQGRDPFISDRDNATGEVTAVCGRIDDWTLRLAPPHIQALFARQRHRTVREALCTLYVAMTRARQGLFMIVDPPTVTKKGEITIPLTHAGVLRAALAPAAVDPGTCHFALGPTDWMAAAGGIEAPAEAPEPARPRLAAATGASAVAAPSPSAHAGAATLDGRLAVGDDGALRRGEAIHALFELVEWIEHFEPDPDELRAVVAATAPRRDGAWAQRQVDEFLGMIERPGIRDALRRGDRDPGTVTVDRERSFARLVDGALQRGTIDRLVIEREGGAIAGATIYDFKTDDIPAGAAATRAETYRSQLEAYRAAVSEQFGLDPARIGMVLLFCGPGVAVRMESEGTDGPRDRGTDTDPS
jgi:ATP-dependent exoDNAse (exonuclease V) beta subunit